MWGGGVGKLLMREEIEKCKSKHCGSCLSRYEINILLYLFYYKFVDFRGYKLIMSSNSEEEEDLSPEEEKWI